MESNFLIHEIFIGTISGGIILFIFIIMNCCLNLLNDSDDSVHVSSVKENKYDLFEYKYLREYQELKTSEEKTRDEKVFQEDLLKLRENVLDEDTPEGLVKMWYDSDLKAFLYYSNKVISYKYLETLARHIVIINNCPSIFIDYCNEILIAREKILNLKKSEDRKIDSSESSEIDPDALLFASFKNYKQNEVSTRNSNVIIPQTSNKYIYKGKLSLYLEEKEKKEKENKSLQDHKTLSFKDFKKLN